MSQSTLWAGGVLICVVAIARVDSAKSPEAARVPPAVAADRVELPDPVKAGPSRGTVLYVDDDAAAGGDGQSWAAAYHDLEDALGEARSDPAVAEVHVAGGVYLPSARWTPDDARSATFQLINGVAVRGGYAGLADSAHPDVRDLALYESILSADFNRDDGPDFANNGENAYHVFYHPEELALDATAVLDGFIITGGHARNIPDAGGGGMSNIICHPTVSNCTFTGNVADSGGGMYNVASTPTVTACAFRRNRAAVSGGGMANVVSSPSVTSCEFEENEADGGNGGGMFNSAVSNPTVTECVFAGNSAASGAGMYNSAMSSPTVTDCEFVGNSATTGGGVYSSGSTVTAVHCSFAGNTAEFDGGGVFSYFSDIILANSTVTGNSAGRHGGGLFTTWISNTSLTNCLLTGNAAAFAGGGVRSDFDSILAITLSTVSDNSAGARGGGLDTNGSRDPRVTNSIVWGNVSLAGPQIYEPHPGTVVRYTCIQGGHAGQGNFDAYPSFVAHGYWDDHGTPDEPGDGFWVPGDYHLRSDSPCINAGDDGAVPVDVITDFEGDDRVQHCRVDTGADETPFLGADCNGNNASDACDIESGISPDEDGNGVPDECRGQVIYVDDSAVGASNGSSWRDAYTDVQDAIRNAMVLRGQGNEIRVAQGTYRPGLFRRYSFHLINGVTLAGGYRGIDPQTPGDPDDRDVAVFETILTGDLNGDDDPDDFPRGPSYTDNAYHVFYHPEELALDATAVLDGFTVSGGNARAIYGGSGMSNHGGGMYNRHSNATVKNCTFKWNSSDYSGGGMYNDHGSPLVANCTFQNNHASWSGGGMHNVYGGPSVTGSTFMHNSARHGGGMYNYISSAGVTRCTFRDNKADYGAGVYNVGCEGRQVWSAADDIQFTYCTFDRNVAELDGGGAYNWCGEPLFATCVFMGNTSGGAGGGVFTLGTPKITNSVLHGNRATESGGGLYTNFSTGPTVANTILWGNVSPVGAQMHNVTESPAVTYSCIERGYAGEGNISADPRFVAPGFWDNNGTPNEPEDDLWVGGDYHLRSDSPCINAGSDAALPEGATTDFEGEERVQHCRVDMGVDETLYTGPDCDADGESDACEIAAGAADANSNGVPDECEDTTCGDGGVWEGVEQCDDGGESQWCDADCTFAICGDGLRNATAGEECDGDDNAACPATFNGGPRLCRVDCTCAPSTCGNNLRDPHEACDGDDNADCRTAECRPDCTCVPPDITEIYRNINPLVLPPGGGFVGQVFAPGAGRRIADDLVTAAVAPCPLSEVIVQVHGGNFDPAAVPGVFDVILELWTGCPGAGGLPISGGEVTVGPLADNALHDVLIALPDHPTPPTTTVWVSAQFSTDSAGVMVGSPPELGYSRDVYDAEPTRCNTHFDGTFPAVPHASFAAQVFAAGTCETHFLAYAAIDETAASFDRGRDVRLGDDLVLAAPVCELSTYEIAVRGQSSPYAVLVDLRRGTLESGPLSVVPGTEATFLGLPGQVAIFRAAFPPGIILRAEDGLWMIWRTNRPDTGVLLAGDTQVGVSTDFYAWEDPIIGWQVEPFPGYSEGVFSIAVNCRGEAPLGACCRQPDEHSGPTGVCADQIPAAACPFDRWLPNESPTDLTLCAYGPFDPPCGTAACCIENDEGSSTCDNLTKEECDARNDCTGDGCLGSGGFWQPGEFCGEGAQRCFAYPCYFAENGCDAKAFDILCHSDADCPADRQPCTARGVCDLPKGCDYVWCCDHVCSLEPSCCAPSIGGGWDDECACLAQEICPISPSNEACWHPGSGTKAMRIPLAREGHRFVGEVPICNLDRPVLASFDVQPSFCCSKAGVEEPGLGTLWYYFSAPENGSARITTCHTPDGPGQDSILQVYRESPARPGTWTSLEAACDNLGGGFACNDDGGCGPDGKLSDICLSDLRPGELVVVIIAAPTGEGISANYTLTIESPCQPETTQPPYSFCHGALGTIQGSSAGVEDEIPFDCSGDPFTLCLENTSLNCPAEPELEAMTNDVWLDYQPGCTGTLRITTCEPEGPSPDTTLAIYGIDPEGGGLCPADGGLLFGANDDAPVTPEEAQFNPQHCSLDSEACLTDDDCVIPGSFCMANECVLPCATSADCKVDAQPIGECVNQVCVRPCDTDADCPLKTCTIGGNLCTLNSNCFSGLCSWDGRVCDRSVGSSPSFNCPRVCRANRGTICTIGGNECPVGDICIAQGCILNEVCGAEVCQSSCWPGSSVTVPVSQLETYKVRLGGEFGSEPVGTLRLTCTDGDCNIDGVPDVCELSCDAMGGVCANFSDCSTAMDCHAEGAPGHQRIDACDIRVRDGGFCTDTAPPCSRDCQGNGIPDDCESEPDSDGDGVLDICDACPASDLADTIEIQGCHTGVGNQVLDNGCTMAETLADCAAGDPNHGQFVRCVTHLANEWRRDSLLTGKDHARIVRCTAGSNAEQVPKRVDDRASRGAGGRGK